eukprot:6212481-Pleurochrysis_carterae.AAC.2
MAIYCACCSRLMRAQPPSSASASDADDDALGLPSDALISSSRGSTEHAHHAKQTFDQAINGGGKSVKQAKHPASYPHPPSSTGQYSTSLPSMAEFTHECKTRLPEARASVRVQSKGVLRRWGDCAPEHLVDGYRQPSHHVQQPQPQQAPTSGRKHTRRQTYAARGGRFRAIARPFATTAFEQRRGLEVTTRASHTRRVWLSHRRRSSGGRDVRAEREWARLRGHAARHASREVDGSLRRRIRAGRRGRQSVRARLLNDDDADCAHVVDAVVVAVEAHGVENLLRRHLSQPDAKSRRP